MPTIRQSANFTKALIPSVLVLSLFASNISTAKEILSTVDSQKSVAVTIYNNNLALVKDKRVVTLKKGVQDLAFREVSALMRPETALLKSEGNHLQTYEQNFDFDLLSPQKLLDKYVGKTVSYITTNPSTGKSKTEKATVLANNGGVVLKIGNRIEANPAGRIVYDTIPDNLRDRPTLVTTLNSKQAGSQAVELSYLTTGLSWKADYVAELSDKEGTIDLSGWVTLNNQSGTQYTNAQLQLVAGEVNQVTPKRQYSAKAVRMEAMVADAAAPAMQEESLLDYHLYTLDNKTTIKQKQTKQVALLSAQQVPVTKQLELVGSNYYYYSRQGELGKKLKPNIYLSFDNKKASQLGVPLPKGILRAYKKDSRGNVQFIGEDRIEHTAKNETVRLKLGQAFDVTADKKQTDFKIKPSTERKKKFYESAYQIEIRNAKASSVTVKVIEPMPGDWEILKQSHKGEKINSHQNSWMVKVPAEGKAILSYRTLVKVYR